MIDHGAVSEYAFASELLARGITPCWPSVETQPYDMVADTGSARYRVQVKSTRKPGPVIDCTFMKSASKRGKKRYSKDDVDFIVLHVVAYQTWYIFPIDDVETGVRLRPGSESCKYRIYHEAWNLLDVRAERG